MPLSGLFPEVGELLGHGLRGAQRKGAMFEEVLIGKAKEHLALLGRSGILKESYLAGGTAAALQLGHRISIDAVSFIRRGRYSRHRRHEGGRDRLKRGQAGFY